MKANWGALLAGASSEPEAEAWVVGAGVALAYWALRLSGPLVLGAFHDDAVYVSLGQALAQGQGYHSIYAAGAPVHLKYPPGLPALYALFWMVGRSLPVVTYLAVASSMAATATAAGLLWWFGRSELGLGRGVLLACAVGPFFLDPLLLYLSLPASEPYFVLGWAVLLALSGRLRRAPSVGPAVALGAVAAATILFRLQALGLLAGLLVALAFRRTPARLLAAVLASSLLPLALWSWMHRAWVAAGPISTQPDEAGYLTWLPAAHPTQWVAFALAALRVNWPAYGSQIPRYLSASPVAGIGLLSLGAGLALAGAVRLGRSQLPLGLTLAGNALVVLLWPWPQDRLALTMLPFAGLLAAGALADALGRSSLPFRRAAYAALGLLGASVALRQKELRVFAYRPVSPRVVLRMPYPGHFIAANRRFVTVVSAWLRDHTVPGDRVVADAPAALYLYSGRQAVAAAPARSALEPSWFEPPGAYLASRILDDRVSVVVLTDIRHPLTPDVAAVFKRCPGVLRYVGTAPWWEGPARAFFYRVVERREPCLEALRNGS